MGRSPARAQLHEGPSRVDTLDTRRLRLASTDEADLFVAHPYGLVRVLHPDPDRCALSKVVGVIEQDGPVD